MKSVGEVMAMGRTFQESLQKAIRGMETGVTGFNSVVDQSSKTILEQIEKELRVPRGDRLWFVADAFRYGLSVEDVFNICSIDPWFLVQIHDLVEEEDRLKKEGVTSLTKDRLRRLKRKGFSDERLAELIDQPELEIRKLRIDNNIRPVFKRVDSCASEFESATAYMYSTYDVECEAAPSDRKKIMILGGGPNRIGQGIEFDYCCVQAAFAMREAGYETIMVNCNPETVSTDYDTSDRLYFEPLTLENVLDIIHVEKPYGVIVQYGGQTPLKLARDLDVAGVPIIGTSPDSIDLAEDRERFQKLLEEIDLKQPPNRTARNVEQAVKGAKEIGYPLVVRPSYVLGGRAMEIVYNVDDLRNYMDNTVAVSNSSPVLLDRFLNNAIEVDVDAISDGTDVCIAGIMEHIEQAGVHSGDSACSLPPFSLSDKIQDKITLQVEAMAHALNVVGLMNTQFAIQNDEIYVLEVNPRASRTIPFVSKATGVSIAKIAVNCMVGNSLAAQNLTQVPVPDYYSVKESVFPFIKFPGVDPLLGPEMKSTGEVMGVGKTFGEAFAKGQLAAGEEFPRVGNAFISVKEIDKEKAVMVARELFSLGYKLFATSGTCKVLTKVGIECERVNKVREGQPHIVDMLKNDTIDLIVNTTEDKKAIADSYSIRRTALQHQVFYTTTITGAMATMEALKQRDSIGVNSLQDLHKGVIA